LVGACSRKLVCSGLIIPSDTNTCVIDKGKRSFNFLYEIPKYAEGTCYYVGAVEYEPLGIFGPRLTYIWRSEELELLDNNTNE